jgi:NADH pyrophosphatase NudC (nudix superfamily)
MAIVNSEKENFLLLKTNPEWLKVDEWFIVTGSVEENETDKEAVVRELKEETGFSPIEIKETNYVCEYEWPKKSGKIHREKAFIVKVEEKSPKLSGEHLDFKWLSKENFIKSIDWYGDKGELKKIIE